MEYNCDSLFQINNERALTVAYDRDLQAGSNSKEKRIQKFLSSKDLEDKEKNRKYLMTQLCFHPGKLFCFLRSALKQYFTYYLHCI